MARLDGMAGEFQPETGWIQILKATMHYKKKSKHRRMVKFNRKKEGNQT
jgi:hypothetical protein